MNEKSDYEKFARVVLWHLSTLEISMTQIQARVIGMTHGGLNTTDTAAEMQDAKRQIRKLAENVYQDALQKAGISSSPEYPPPFSDNGHAGDSQSKH